MNCEEYWRTLAPHGHHLNAEQAAHMAQCLACATQWEQHRALAARVDTMRAEWRSEEAPARVEAGLTAAFRANGSSQGRRAAGYAWWTPVFAWASAAAATFAIAVVLIRGSHSLPVRPDTVAAPRHAVQSAPELALGQDGDAEDDASILGDGFVHLPNAPRIEPNEPVDFVQLAFPRSEMIALGLPVSEDQVSDTVLADVALGSDGTARAVRLVADGGTF